MKKILTLGFISLIINVTAHSQGCGWEDFVQFQSTLDYDFNNWTSGNETFNVKLRAHVLVDANGSPMADEQFITTSFDLLQQTCDANFMNITFDRTLCTNYFTSADPFGSFSSDNVIDVYFYDPDYVGSSWGGFADKTSISLRGKFRNRQDEDPVATTNILAHEVGHVLGLEHTFAQTALFLKLSIVGPDPSPLNLSPEPVDKTIAEGISTGDRIFDTPADPFGGFTSVLSWCPLSNPGSTNVEWNYVNCRRDAHDCLSVDNRRLLKLRTI